MKKQLVLLTSLALLGLSMPTTSYSSNSSKVKSGVVSLSPGIYDVPIELSKSLESRRKELRQDFINAQIRLKKFADENGWASLLDKSLVKKVEIYDTKAGWDKRLRQFYPDAPKVIPKTFSAAIEKDIFFSVSPDVYLVNFPEGGKESNAFEKLITHELAHRLHVRICKGDENKMGPMWFWEGYAVYAADQLNYNSPKLSHDEIWKIARAKDRGSYLKYNVVFRYFLDGMTLSDYVKKAGEPNFMSYLEKREAAATSKK